MDKKNNSNSNSNSKGSDIKYEFLKDALKSGQSPEDMLKDFQSQLRSAQEEIHTETVKAEKVTTARKNLVNAMLAYLLAADYIDEEDLKDSETKQDLVDILTEIFTEAEEGFKSNKEAFKILKNMSEMPTPPKGLKVPKFNIPSSSDFEKMVDMFLRGLE